MSWHPTFWVSRAGFSLLKERAPKKLAALVLEDSGGAWEFSIAGRAGVVMYANSELTRPNEALHTLLKTHGVEHWVLDGEGASCPECRTWGEKLDEYST